MNSIPSVSNRAEIASQAQKDYYNQLMATYEKRTQSLSGRKIEYIQKNKEAKKELLMIVGGGALSGAIAGGAVGGIVGGLCGCPGGPPGIVLGAAIGAPVGMIIGAAVGAGVAVVVLRPRYQKWCRTEAGREFSGQLSIFLNDNKILEHLTCPITDMPVVTGVRTPSGQLYEKDEIEKWIIKQGTDPITREPLRQEDLILDENASLESGKVFVKFLKDKREETKNYAPNLIEGYDVLIKDTREAALFVHNNKLVALQKRWRDDKITYEEFTEQSKALSEKYLIG